MGAPFIILGKFIPGTAGLVAAAAGLAGFRLMRFAAIDVVALLLWTTLWTGLGWMLDRPIEDAMPFLRKKHDPPGTILLVS